MKKRVKTRTFSGVICEQEIYTVSDRVKDPSMAPRRLRFQNEEQRAKHRQEMSRKKFVRMVNETCDPSFLYSTLTFNNANEVHTFWEARQIRDLFYRRLMYAFPGVPVIIVMGRGKHTKRIHLHMISGGIPEEVIAAQWIYGTIVSCENLREHNYYEGIDHGQDYTGLANYLFDHWTPEQGGHRWKASRSVKSPEPERAKEIKRNYSEDKPPQAPPGYVLVETKSTPYGYQYFKYIKAVSIVESDNGQQTLRGWAAFIKPCK